MVSMNVIFVLIVLIAFLFAGWQQIFFVPDEGGPVAMEILSKAMIESAVIHSLASAPDPGDGGGGEDAGGEPPDDGGLEGLV